VDSQGRPLPSNHFLFSVPRQHELHRRSLRRRAGMNKLCLAPSIAPLTFNAQYESRSSNMQETMRLTTGQRKDHTGPESRSCSQNLTHLIRKRLGNVACSHVYLK
jgi:hypothetical protein